MIGSVKSLFCYLLVGHTGHLLNLIACLFSETQSSFCDPGWPQAHYDHPALASLDGGSKSEMPYPASFSFPINMPSQHCTLG